MTYICVLIHIWNKNEDGAPLNRFKPSSKIFYLSFQSGTSFVDLLCFCSVLCLLCLCVRLFICALWSPAGKGLTSWLLFVVSNCEFATFSLVSWVGCGTWLYRFLIFAPLLTLVVKKKNQRKIAIIFLSTILNLCFGCPKEPSQWDGSLSIDNICFDWEIRKIIFSYALLHCIWGTVKSSKDNFPLCGTPSHVVILVTDISCQDQNCRNNPRIF